MKSLTLIAPDGTKHELVADDGNGLVFGPSLAQSGALDVYERVPHPTDPVDKWLARIPATWAVFNGD